MDVLAENPEDDRGGKSGQEATHAKSGASEARARATGDGAEIAKHHDRMGKIPPLTKEEIEALSTIELSEEGHELPPGFSDYLEQAEELINLVQSMVTVEKSDEERQEDDDELDNAKDAIEESFILTLKGVYEYCGSTDAFLGFVGQFVLDQTNKRVSELQKIFGDEGDAFDFATPRRTYKRIANRAAVVGSDKDLPDSVGAYFIQLLEEDIAVVRQLIKETYRDQDMQELKRRMLEMCITLDEIRKRLPPSPFENEDTIED